MQVKTAGAAICSALAEKGFFDVDYLKTHYKNGGFARVMFHIKSSGVELSTGSLGHGLSVGAGMAYNCKIEKQNYKIFVILGDGENDEGSIWEAALVANHFKLNNLIVMIDYNKMQSLDFVVILVKTTRSEWKALGGTS